MNTINFDIPTGRIICVGNKPEGSELCPSQLWAGGITEDIGATHYILKGDIVERPIMGTTIEASTIKHIPVGAQVFIGNTPYIVEDGELEVDLTYPGVYKVHVTHFPYLDFIGEITK